MALETPAESVFLLRRSLAACMLIVNGEETIQGTEKENNVGCALYRLLGVHYIEPIIIVTFELPSMI